MFERIKRLFKKDGGDAVLSDKCILAIDDDKGYRQFLKDILSAKYKNIILVEDGETGISLAAKHVPDLIILDLGLGSNRMQGKEVFLHLKEDNKTKQIPIIILTINDSPFNFCEYLSIGAYDYVVKPIDGKTLLGKVKDALSNSEPSENFEND